VKRRIIMALAFVFLLVGLVATMRPVKVDAATAAVWVGAPNTMTWPNSSGCSGATFPSATCSLPNVHHWLSSTRAPYGDWAADFQSMPVGTPVYLYAAPQYSSVPVTAVIDKVGPACSDGYISHGGYAVTVAFYTNGTRIGSATYAHINPSVSQGATVSRWGTQLGTVGSYNSAYSCWKGSHVHFQMYSQVNYACYARRNAGQQMYSTNFVGYVGGSFAYSARQQCP
jgi:hypothetical protein